MERNKIEIVIAARDAASGVINSVVSATRQYRQTLTELNGTANQAAHAIRNLFVAIGGYSIFKEAISTGYKFNSMIEDSRAGLAGLIASMNEIRDAQGNVVSGQEKFSAAMAIAAKVQERLRIEGLKTAATYEQLNKAYAQAYVPAKEAGFSEEQIVAFTTRIVQAATMMKVPLDMLGEELRSILTGRMQPRTTLLMPLMESIGLTNEKIKELTASGKLFEEFMKRSEGVLQGAEAAANNFSVRLSNLKDALQQAFGKAFETGFEKTKALIQEITDWIVQIDEKTGKITWNEDFINTLKKIDDLIFKVVDGVKSVVKGISDFATSHPMLTDMVIQFGKLIAYAVAVGAGLRLLGSTIAWLAAQHAANIAFITRLFDGWITTLKGIQLGALTTSGVMTKLGTAASIVGAALAGWQIGSWISRMELGKKTISEWIQLGMIKLTEYLEYIKYVFAHVPIYAQKAWAIIKLTLKKPFISEEAYREQLAEIEKITEERLKELQERYKQNLAQVDIMKEMLEAESQARHKQVEVVDRAKNSMDNYSSSTNKSAKILTEYVLKLRDVNNVLDRMVDILDSAKKRSEELILETKKTSLSDRAARFIDIAKDYEENLIKAREYAKDAERVVREAYERLEKAREEAAEKNKKREKSDPFYGIDPKVFEALKEAEKKKQEIIDESNRIIIAANKKRIAAIAKLDEEINNEITEKNRVEIEKRIEEIKKWEREMIDALNTRYLEEEYAYAEYWARRERITKTSTQLINKILDESRQQELEAIARHNLAVLDMAEKEMSLSKVDIAKGRIRQYETLLGFYEEMRKKAIESGDITARLNVEAKIDETKQRLNELTWTIKELTGSFTEGWERKLREYLYNLKTTFQLAKDIATETAQAMQQAFSDFFFDAFEGKLKSLADYLNSFLSSVKRALANALGQQVSGAIISGIGRLFGSGREASTVAMNYESGTGYTLSKTYVAAPIQHGGGFAHEARQFRLLPRFHTGIGPDEVLSIIRKDEAVFTPGQLKALGSVISKTPQININYNIKNESDSEIQTDEPQVRFDGEAWWIDTAIRVLRAKPDVRKMFQTGGRG